MVICIDPNMLEWNNQKENENVRKHGVDFTEAAKVFFDDNRIIAVDDAHSKEEKRYFCIGKTRNGIATVRFTIRGRKIRIIGAGYWRKGKKIYEKENLI